MDLIIGGAQLGSKYSLGQKKEINLFEIEKIFDLANKNNINKIDFSFDYGNQDNILFFLNKFKFDLYLKVKSDFFKLSNKNILNVFYKLKNKYQNINFVSISIHNTDFISLKQIENIQAKIDKLKKEKIFKFFGLSTYNPNIFKLYDLGLFDLIQFPFNLLDNRFLEKKNIIFLKKMKFIQARSIFLQGLLLMSIQKQSRLFPNHNPLWKKLDHHCNKLNISKYELCLNFLRKHKEINQLIFGVDNLNQLKKMISHFKKDRYQEISGNFKINDEKLLLPYNWNLKNERLA